ncbi:MAG: zinc ribbon domain-containing protein [Chloroflexi bacterium]|nr:zinc ribbon domain-containing protein [Chloroflexota bacterium]
MPVYEYQCTSCQVRFERKQSFSDDPIRVCPTCGGQTRRVFFPAGIIFKGSGWYITDSRKATSSDGSAKEPAKEPAKESAKDGEAKPEVKSEPRGDAKRESSTAAAGA